MAHQYPRVGASKPLDRGLCSCCQHPAVRRVDIQVSYMRGDDEVLKLCLEHLQWIDVGRFAALFEEARTTNEMRRMMNKSANPN